MSEIYHSINSWMQATSVSINDEPNFYIPAILPLIVLIVKIVCLYQDYIKDEVYSNEDSLYELCFIVNNNFWFAWLIQLLVPVLAGFLIQVVVLLLFLHILIIPSITVFVLTVILIVISAKRKRLEHDTFVKLQQ